jgi:hypothetical protein
VQGCPTASVFVLYRGSTIEQRDGLWTTAHGSSCQAYSQIPEDRSMSTIRRSSLTFSMFSLPRLALPWAGCTESAQSREHRECDVDGAEKLLFSMFSLPRKTLPWAGCTSSAQSREHWSISMVRRSSLTFSMFSLPRLAHPWAGCTESAQNRERRAVDVDGAEKLLDFLDVLFAPVASLGGMYIACTKLGTKVDVDVEDRRSSFTFSMFSLPRLLPWAGCTASSQSWEHRVVDLDGAEKLLYFLDVLLATVASLGGMYSVCAKRGTKVDVDVEDRRSSFTFSMFSLPRLLPWA